MLLNNFLTMQRIRELLQPPLTPQLVMDMHRLVMRDTLDDTADAGRLRPAVFHVPPPAEGLPERLEALCRFANGETPEGKLSASA
jgi:Fic family protein